MRDEQYTLAQVYYTLAQVYYTLAEGERQMNGGQKGEMNKGKKDDG